MYAKKQFCVDTSIILDTIKRFPAKRKPFTNTILMGIRLKNHNMILMVRYLLKPSPNTIPMGMRLKGHIISQMDRYI